MSIVYHTNKKTGVTYAYENIPYWDKEKQQSRAKRKPLGRVDQETKVIVPTREYKRKDNNVESSDFPSKPWPNPITRYQRNFYGATYLLDRIGEETGVTADLKASFPDTYKQILSVAYFLILEDSNALSRFSHWQRFHIHPYGKDIPSQRSSELFQSIDEEGRVRFFEKQGRRRIENEYWAFDITTISSYSEVLMQVKNGLNKEHDRLPQINLALLFGQKSGLPFYYRKLPGNITDVKTLKNLLLELNVMGYSKVNIVLDRGFYSKDNINALFRNHRKFIVGTKLSLKYVKDILDTERDNLRSWSTYQSQFGTYAICKTIDWEYEQERPYKGDILHEKRRAYLHLFYNPEKAARDLVESNDYINALRNDLEQGTLRDYRAKDYERYFHIKETPKRARKVIPSEAAIDARTKNHGFYALLTNEVKDPFESLSLYRSKDMAEKAFGDLKERLQFRRMQVSSELSLNGKFFVEFVALIFLSYVKKSMQDAKLFDRWTLQGVLDELDAIELFQAPGHGRFLGEITNKQLALFDSFGIVPPR